VNVRADTGARPSYEQRASDSGRLVAWCVFVGLLILLAYVQRIDTGSPDRNVFYRYSTAASSVTVYALILLITGAIAGFRRDLLALRRPRSWPRALGLGLAIILIVYTAIALLEPLLHGGREQGLTPAGWQPEHAAAYVVNALVIAVLVPFVEELLFRGVGFSLLEPHGTRLAILVVGVAFGLAHGLVGGFVQIALFGCALAWLRSRVDSAVPGMFVHGTFNAIGLIAAVTVGN
jgi:membrane protease YdiL (CAAX protease family)